MKAAVAAVKKHKKKSAAVLSIATLVTGLQVMGMLGPMVCSLPFIHNQASCLATTQKASDAAVKLHALDGMKLDDGSPFMVETMEPLVDGGQ